MMPTLDRTVVPVGSLAEIMQRARTMAGDEFDEITEEEDDEESQADDAIQSVRGETMFAIID